MWLSAPRGMPGVQVLPRRPSAPASLLSWHVPSQIWWRTVSLSGSWWVVFNVRFWLKWYWWIWSTLHIRSYISHWAAEESGPRICFVKIWVFSVNVHSLSPRQTDSSRGEASCLPAGVPENMAVLAPPSGWRWESHNSFCTKGFPICNFLDQQFWCTPSVLLP